ncbi:MAG: pitrilysin family protein [Clostridiales bacterium]|nr:pitrilysin family protein [Clostridiales bacterium]
MVWAWAIFSEAKETSRSFTLDNGLRAFLLEKRNVPLVNVVVAVNLGSKDETAETSGLVHVLEHFILFRGTKLRSGSEISQEVRRHGGYFNAHTTQDLVFFEISVPSEHADFALRNQKEILFDLKLTQEDLDKEKEVIFEELGQIEDDPIRYATALVYQNLFQGHPYGNPIYGNKEVIHGLTVDNIQAFYKRYFVPSNCALAVVGDFDAAEMEKRVKAVFGDVTGPTFEPVAFGQPQLPKKGTTELEVELDVNKAYLVIGALAPDYNHPDQYAMDVLTQVFGRGLNPMLGSVLRGRRRLVETVFMDYHAHQYGGLALVYLTLDPRNVQAAKRETITFLKRAYAENFSPDDLLGEERLYAYDYLSGAKNQIRYNASQSQEKGLSIATALVRHLLLGKADTAGSYLKNIEELTSSDIRKAAAKYFGRGEYVVVSIVPKKKD